MATAFPYDFFISRRGPVAETAREVADVLEAEGYKVKLQDYDSLHGESFVRFMNEALRQARHLFVLHTEDYLTNEWTSQEFESFRAQPDRDKHGRRVCVLRCDPSKPGLLLASLVHGNLSGVTDPDERRSIILRVARGEAMAARPGPRIFGGAMPAANRLFTGRTQLLADMHAALHADTAALTAAHGMGGVGKTALARAYVREFGAEYAGVWWLLADKPTSLLGGLANLARELDQDLPPDTKLDDAAAAALAHVAGHSGTPYLLIYDNAPKPDALRGLLPTRGGCVLITSRWPDWQRTARPLPVDTLPEDEAVEFLLRRARREDAAGARALARRLGCLPLALDHAGAYISQTPGLGFAGYAARLDERLAVLPDDAEYPRSVAETFTVAIERAGAAAETLLGLFAHLAPEAIPLSLLDDSVLPAAAREAGLRALAAVSLVATPAEDTVSLHRLVQAVMRARLAARGGAEAARDAAVARLAAAFPNGAYRDTTVWPACRALLPHVEALLDTLPAEFGSVALGQVLNRAGSFVFGIGLLAAAQVLMLRAVAVNKRVLGAGHLETLTSRNDLGACVLEMGNAQEAKSHFDFILPILAKIAGAENEKVLSTRNNLAVCLRALGDAAGAESQFRAVLLGQERRLPSTHPHLLLIRNNIACCLKDQNKLEGAKAEFRSVLLARQQVLGDEHLDTLRTKSDLADCLLALRDAAGAASLACEVLEVRINKQGPEHPETLSTLYTLAECQRVTGDRDNALASHQRVLAFRERVLPQEHPDTLLSMTSLGICLLNKGNLEEAERMLLRALAGFKRRLGAGHPNTRAARDALAEVRRRRGGG